MLLSALDVARDLKEEAELEQFDLMALPGERYQAGAIDFQATLQEARERISESGTEALYVTRTTVPGIARVYGILTAEDIESSYRL
jgi:CIC family chloride channel protein